MPRDFSAPPVGILFDLDGTLVDSRIDLANAANAVRRHLGRSELPRRVVTGYVGDGARALLRRVLAHPDAEGGRPHVASEEAVDAIYPVFAREYGSHLLDHTRLYPGIAAMLDAVGDRPLFLATNKPGRFAADIVEGLGLAGVFQRIVGGDDPLRRKPHPDHLLACLAGTGLDPRRCAMVGDSANDVAPARRLGMTAVAVAWGLVAEDDLRALDPDAVVHDADELTAVLAAGHD